MANFIKIDNMDKMQFSSRWKNSPTFHSQGRYINKKGEYVKASYPGTLFHVALKKERAYSACERIGRLIEGIFYSILTLGFCNLKAEYRNLFIATKKVCRFAVRVPTAKITISQPIAKEAAEVDDI